MIKSSKETLDHLMIQQSSMRNILLLMMTLYSISLCIILLLTI